MSKLKRLVSPHVDVRIGSGSILRVYVTEESIRRSIENAYAFGVSDGIFSVTRLQIDTEKNNG
jgi:hypothetical protein